MTAVEDYIYTLEGRQRELMLYLHGHLVNALNLEDKLRYNIPFYFRKSWICYLNPIKKEGIEIAFLRGKELSNEQGILDSKGRKQVSGIVFTKPSEIPLRALTKILQEAILLDDLVPYGSKRKKGK